MGYWINYQSARGTAPAEKRVDPAQIESGYADIYGNEWPKYRDRNGEETYAYISLDTENPEAGYFFEDSSVKSLLLPSGCEILTDLGAPPGTSRITVRAADTDPSLIPLLALDDSYCVMEDYPVTLYDWATSSYVEGETDFDPDDVNSANETLVTFVLDLQQQNDVHVNDVTDDRGIELCEEINDVIAPNWGHSFVILEDIIAYEDGPYALTAADLPALEAEGYQFQGWSLDGAYVFPGDTINSNVTLEAVWQATGGGESKPDQEMLVLGFICGLLGKGVL